MSPSIYPNPGEVSATLTFVTVPTPEVENCKMRPVPSPLIFVAAKFLEERFGT